MAYIIYTDKQEQRLREVAEEYGIDKYALENAHENMLNANFEQDIKDLAQEIMEE